MSVFDLFSKRQRRARGETPDVYRYDSLPNALRVQIIHIIRDAVGEDGYGTFHAAKAYELIKNTLCREYGVFELVERPESDMHSVFNFFLREESVERALDVVELAFKFIASYIAGNMDYLYYTTRKIEPRSAVAELNDRFKEHGIGFQFESNELIRIDSDFLHSEAVKPALTVLAGEGFSGANDEFLSAHEHYRHGRYKECLVDCLKAFESTIKAICKQRGWVTQPTDNAKNLITICFDNGLLPTYLESQFASLRSLLESGVPTVRNRNGGHGQGVDTIIVPEHVARYALNLTATNSLFLVDAHNAKGK
jgi:hypothetical protein